MCSRGRPILLTLSLSLWDFHKTSTKTTTLDTTIWSNRWDLTKMTSTPDGHQSLLDDTHETNKIGKKDNLFVDLLSVGRQVSEAGTL